MVGSGREAASASSERDLFARARDQFQQLENPFDRLDAAACFLRHA